MACSLFGRRSKDAAAASTAAAAAAPIRADSLRSQPSFDADRSQHADEIGKLTVEKAKQQASEQYPTPKDYVRV